MTDPEFPERGGHPLGVWGRGCKPTFCLISFQMRAPSKFTNGCEARVDFRLSVYLLMHNTLCLDHQTCHLKIHESGILRPPLHYYYNEYQSNTTVPGGLGWVLRGGGSVYVEGRAARGSQMNKFKQVQVVVI